MKKEKPFFTLTREQALLVLMGLSGYLALKNTDTEKKYSALVKRLEQSFDK